MTIDITKPLDTELARTLPGYIRETRAALEGAVTDSSAALAAVGILENDVDNLAALIAAALVKFPNQGVFVNGDATPSVSGGIIYRTANTTSTAITYLDGGFAGQMVIIVADDENTTVVHNPGYIILEGGVSITFNANQGIILVCHENSIGNKQWIQVGSIGGGSSTGNAKFNRDTFTVGVGGQSSFDTSVAFQTGQKLMFPYVNGELQPSSKFTEVDSNTITFSETLPEGTFVELVYITTLSVTTSVDDLFVVNKPYIDVRQYNSLSEANTVATLQNKLLVVSTSQSVAANLDLTAKIHLLPGGAIEIAAGYNTVFSGGVTLAAGSEIDSASGTLSFTGFVDCKGGTINAAGAISITGAFRADLYNVFTGSGAVTFGSGVVAGVYPEWWGALGDGTADDSVPMAKLLASGASTVTGPGSYKINNVAITAPVVFKNMYLVPFTVGANTGGFVANGVSNITFDSVQVSTPNDTTRAATLFRGTSCDYFKLTNSHLDFCGIYLLTSSDITIKSNIFINGWGNHAYNAGSMGSGLSDGNLYRTIDINNLADDYRCDISNNSFDNVWSAIYADSCNDLIVTGNKITNTADTAVFDRCAVGITYNKNLSNNTLQNIGKAAIKLCDSNNLTAKGHNGVCVGNTIIGYGLYLSSEAILCANYFDYGGTNTYLKAPSGSRSTGIIISSNTITATSSTTSDAFTIANLDSPIISDNIINTLLVPTDFNLQWCFNGVFSGNSVIANGQIHFYDCDGTSIIGNYLNGTSFVKMTSVSGSKNIFDSNMVVNTNASVPTGSAFGLAIVTSGATFSVASVCNNTFSTTIAYEDSNVASARSILAVGTDANAARTCCDNNKVIYSDMIGLNKQMFGNLLYPAFYGGIAGAAKYDSVTRRLTIKPTADRVATDYITFSD